MKNIHKILKISQSIILSIVITVIPLASSVSATNSFYSGNDILFYDENANVATSCTSTGGGTIVEKVWSFFIEKGLTEIQTAGIIGNMYQESSISPTAWETIKTEDSTSNKNILADTDTAHAWGISQWDGSRRYYESSSGTKSGVLGKLITEKPHLEKYISSTYSTGGSVIKGDVNTGYTLSDENPLASKNIPEADLNELLTFELEYTWYEMPGEYDYNSDGTSDGVSAMEKIKTATTIFDATVFYHDYFERSGDSENFVQTVRVGYSQAIYNKMKGISPNGDCGTGDKFIDTVKSYVWPTHKGWYKLSDSSALNRDAIIPTDGYKNAVVKATSEGRYTGDPCSDLGVGSGIDCGGFVTTFIHDSGLDANYNAAKGNTTTQKAWLDANWQNLGNASSIDTSTLRPGDVAIYSIINDDNQAEGHTFVYIGNIDGFQTNVASASQCNRAPMAGKESLTDEKYTWYRKK